MPIYCEVPSVEPTRPDPGCCPDPSGRRGLRALGQHSGMSLERVARGSHRVAAENDRGVRRIRIWCVAGGIWTIAAGVICLAWGLYLPRMLERVRDDARHAGRNTERLDGLLASALFRRLCATVGTVVIVVGFVLIAT